jgi:hypothetical protein
LTWPETTSSEGPRHFILTGPYAVSVEVYAAASSPRGKLAAVEVSEAVLEIRYGDTDVREVALSMVADDWNAEPGPQWDKFALHQSRTPRLDVDFRRLKEIRFRLKFTGIYVNGGRREYWLERYLKPKVFIEMEPSALWRETRNETLAACVDSCFYQASRLITMPPNPAVNTDAPSAGLRARRGSPVTLIR